MTYLSRLPKGTRKPDEVEVARDMLAKGEAAGPEHLRAIEDAIRTVYGEDVLGCARCQGCPTPGCDLATGRQA